jgi:hypothetical protein
MAKRRKVKARKPKPISGGALTYNHAHFASLSCPTNVTWTNDISRMFTSVDVDHMNKAPQHIQLDNYQSVKIWAVSIYTAVKNKSMPLPGTIGPDGKLEQPWPANKVNTFGVWFQQGCPM